MSFKSDFNNYCDATIPTFLWKDEKVLKRLLSSYSDKDFFFIVNKIRSYGLKGQKNEILRRNLYAVIDYLFDKFSSEQKRQIAEEFSKKILKFQNEKFEYSDYFYELKILVALNPIKKIIISVYKNEDDYHAYKYFLDYAIENNDRKFFEEIMNNYFVKYELTYDVETFRYFDFKSEDNLNYILGSLSTINNFLELLSSKFNALSGFFDGYYLNKDKIVDLFSKGKSIFVQRIIKKIIEKYYEYRDYNIDRIIKSDVFVSILKSQNKNKKFIDEMFSYIVKDSHQYYKTSNYILKGLISCKLIDCFFKYNRANLTIFSIYYSLSDNDIEQKKIKELFYGKYTQIIDVNDLKNNEYKQKDLSQLTEDEKNIKSEIMDIVSKVNELEATTKEKYFSARILYLYKNYKELFDDEQFDFVKRQIDLYFTSESTDPSNKNAKVIISEGNKFSWPGFIPDLQLCLEIAVSEGLNLDNYIERISYLIPYLFDSDYQLIINEFKKNKYTIKDEKYISWIIDIYSHKIHGNLGYFHPCRIISLFDNNIFSFDDGFGFTMAQKEKLSKICEWMIKSNNERISVWEKISYIEFISKKSDFLDYSWLKEYYENLYKDICSVNYFEDYLYGKINEGKVTTFRLFCALNKSLIEILRDDDAIKWRLKQLKGIKTDFSFEGKTGIVHGINNLEEEYIRGGHDNTFFYSVLSNLLKYDKYESDIAEILNIAKKFKGKNSAVRRYIYNFAAAYYKTVPNNKKIDIYSKLNNKEFVVYYLGAAYWSEKKKEKYKRKVKENKIFKNKDSMISELKFKLERLELEIANLKLENHELSMKKMYLEFDKSKNEKKLEDLRRKIIILTEGKTDWKHMLRMSNELKLEFPEKQNIYDFFIDNVVQYENDMGGENLSIFVEKLAGLYPEYKIIGIIDTDGNNIINKGKWEKIVNSEKCHIFKKGNFNNLRLVTLTEPRNYKKLKTDYYDKYNWCIELFYSDKQLKNRLITPRDIKSSGTLKKYGVRVDKIKVGRKNIYVKHYDDLKINIFDRNSNNNLFDINGDSFNQLLSKNEFANLVLNNDIKFSKNDIKIFEPLFDAIYQAYLDMLG